MATKKELEVLVKKLTDKVRELTEQLRSAHKVIDDSDTPHRAVSLIKEDDNYFMVELRFNSEGASKVISKTPCNKDRLMAEFLTKKFLVEEIINKLNS